MSKYGLISGLTALCLFVSGPVSAATMTGTKYVVRMLNANTAGGGGLATNTSGTYALLTSVGQLGAQASSGSKYSINSGIINSLRPATATLDFAYAYPNPFKKKLGHTIITFTKLTYEASIKIYTISGEHVCTINKSSGVDNVSWDVRNDQGQALASGLYIYLIESGSLKKTGKLIIIK